MAPTERSAARRDADGSRKGRSKGFSVGPANLPDGTYKRKAQKIKQDLIHRASVKRSYAKLRAQNDEQIHHSNENADSASNDAEPTATPASIHPHPERQAMITASSKTLDSADTNRPRVSRGHKPNPFHREAAAARRAKEAVEAKQQAIKLSQQQKVEKRDQRERWQRELAKARGQGKSGSGKRKLGRESKVLLEKVQRMLEREKDEG